MSFLRQHIARFFGIGLIGIFYLLSLQPTLSSSEESDLAAQFRFTASTLPEVTGFEQRQMRDVHPDLAHIAGWMSAMGAAVALNDLDGDGLPNDVCSVDIRIDQVIVAPAPHTPDRYAPFVLDHSGIDYDAQTMAPVGCLPNDMNEDGRMDLLIYYWGRTPVAFLRNDQSVQPVALDAAGYTAVEILPNDEVWWSSAATFADFDGDGHADLLVTNYFPDDTVILGDAEGTPTWMQHSLSNAFNGGGTHIFLWDGATQGDRPGVAFRRFENVFDERSTHAWTLAVGAADLDDDLLPEIYFANDYGPDRLFHNRSTPGELRFALLNGERGLTTPKSRVLGHDSFKGMGVDFGDLNNDGHFDIYVSNIAADYALHESHFMFLSTGETARMNDGIAPYVDQGEELGVARTSWSWEARLADFNNDGVLEAVQATGFKRGEVDRWPELQELGLGSDELTQIPANWPNFGLEDDLNGHVHNAFFVRSSSGRFFDLAPAIGIDEPQVSRGIATADVDGDGDLDFAVANQWASSRFYRNDCTGCGAFLGLNLLLPLDANAGSILRAGHPGADTPGRPAIGAFVSVKHPDGRVLVSAVDGGNGQSGERSSDIFIGLGDLPASDPVDVELRWRDANGAVHTVTLQLTSGWHTVLLGNDIETAERIVLQ